MLQILPAEEKKAEDGESRRLAGKDSAMGETDWKSRLISFSYSSRAKIIVSLLAIVLLFVLPGLSGWTIPGMGKITLSWMQLFYGVLSLELALAVYTWGVGNWSRFEPPPGDADSATLQKSDAGNAQAAALPGGQ
jgi:hypothetical protein